MRSWFLLPLLFWPLGAHAQVADTTAEYALYVLGLQMAVGQVHLVYDPASYRMDIRMHTTGAAKVFVSGEQDSLVEGRWQAAAPLPAVLNSTGTWNGDPHKLVISFAGGTPVVTTLIPPERKKREPIPPEQLRDSVDIPSAIAALVRQVASTGSCERRARTFDGRRLAEITVHDDGEENLPPTERSSFNGKTKRCAFEIRQLSGFEHGDDLKEAKKPQRATAWLARLSPDGPLMPVRIDMQARLVGAAQLVIISK